MPMHDLEIAFLIIAIEFLLIFSIFGWLLVILLANKKRKETKLIHEFIDKLETHTLVKFDPLLDELNTAGVLDDDIAKKSISDIALSKKNLIDKLSALLINKEIKAINDIDGCINDLIKPYLKVMTSIPTQTLTELTSISAHDKPSTDTTKDHGHH